MYDCLQAEEFVNLKLMWQINFWSYPLRICSATLDLYGH